jgi:thiamine biosynthesis protein ThiS
VSDIDIEVNGSARSIPSGSSIEALLRELELDGRTVVVELNRQIVRRTELADTRLEAGDRVELVHFVGGG